MAMSSDATYEGKLTVSFKDEMRNLANFTRARLKV